VLGVPLPAKLLGANALLLLAAGLALAAAHRSVPSDSIAVVALTLLVSAAANVALVRLALRPLRDLESTAERVWRGDLAARVPRSPVADHDVARVGHAFNLVLDGLVDDRARLRRLAADVVRAGDRERALVARELHDSAAQTLAAATYQLAALGRDAEEGVTGAELAERAAAARAMVAGVLEEVRLLAHTVYPRVLDDLGLAAALHTLGDRAQEHAPGVDIAVIVDPAAEGLRPDVVPPATASALYRVAQESVTNALRHARPECLTVVLRAVPGARSDGPPAALTVEVSDDGAGFDVADADARRPGMGLFVMRERVALAGGAVAVESTPGGGTRVRATVPLGDDELAPRATRLPLTAALRPLAADPAAVAPSTVPYSESPA
jgi:signal transduction histidine kinase